MSAQRRSVHPNVRGVPWWGAILIAVTASAVGFAFDAGGGKELTHVFAVLYAIGCIAAVLMVRQSAIFTAVVQPPMILFFAVPGAYFLFHDAKLGGPKDIVINCAYPLIQRFPLMVFTAGAVLLIGLGRWFVGGSGRAEAEPAPAAQEAPSRLAALTSKITGMFSPPVDEEEDATPKRRHAERPRPSRSTQPAKAAKRAEPTRQRRARPPLVEEDLPPERSRRRTPPSWHPEEPVDLPRRRPPVARTGHNPYERREPYERRAPHERRSRYDYDYEPFEAYEPPPRRRPGTNGAAVANETNGTNGTHHPISRVRYRGSPTDAELRQERPARSSWSRSSDAEHLEYDI